MPPHSPWSASQDSPDRRALLDAVKRLCRQAGAAILEVYEGAAPLDLAHKDDASPVTAADLAAHAVLQQGLEALAPTLPVLSEESVEVPWEVRRHWRRYWLVDPLDGTREFLKRNGEFTVNVALVEDGVPVLGVVHVPVTGLLYSGLRGVGAWKELKDDTPRPIHTAALHRQSTLRAVASRSHGTGALTQWLAAVESRFAGLELLNMGSSLKICLVAEGKADIYPRLALTSEWDTAAAHAVLEAAGGMLCDLQLQPYHYNRKADILNPWFYAIGDRGFAWREALQGLNC